MIKLDPATQMPVVHTSRGKPVSTIAGQAEVKAGISTGVAKGLKLARTLGAPKMDVQNFVNEIKRRVQP